MKNRFVFFTTHMRTLSVMVLLACSVASGWACDVDHLHRCAQNSYNYADYPNRNWVERLVEKNPNKPLRDMSIVCAHDAGTWFSTSYRYKDQTYCERELFLKGVREFDLRLDFYEGKIYLRHGDRDDYYERYNKLSDEIEYHFPTKEELNKEFLILDFSYEATTDREHKKATFYEFIRLIVKKYGQTNIIGYKNGMTISEAQGKIILKYGTDAGSLRSVNEVENGLTFDFNTPNYSADDLKDFDKDWSWMKVPITTQIGGWTFAFDYKTFNGNEHSALVAIGKKARDKDKGETTEHLYRLNHEDSLFIDQLKLEYFYGNGEWSLNRANKRNEIKQNLEKWLAPIDGHNKFNVTQLNGYYWGGAGGIVLDIITSITSFGFKWLFDSPTKSYSIEYGKDICADWGDNCGMNHTAYDILKRHTYPYGIIQFDFCGTESVDGHATYGNKLLELCIENNFSDHMPYVKEVFVGKGTTEEEAKKQLRNLNCEIICESHDNATKGDSYTYIGWTTTAKIEESVSDVIIVKGSDSNSKPEKEIQVDGRTYHLATLYESSWNGDIDWRHRNDKDHKPLFLYYSKNDDLSGSGFRTLTELKVSSKAFSSDYTHVNGCTYSKGTYTIDPQGSHVEGQLKHIGFASKSHQHTYTIEYVDDDHHQEVCSGCLHKNEVVNHKKVYVPNVYGSHKYVCEDCEAVFVEKEDCEGTFDNGFGECKKCHNVLFDVPGMDADSTALISNAGQLVVFSLAVISNPKMHAKLTADIDFGKDKAKWIPIGFNEQYPYKGIFDGQGHVIKGIERAETDSLKYDGVFGVTDGAMIRNLGVTDCHFRGENAGVFVGAIGGSFTNIENCFSNAIAQNCVDGTLSRGGDFYGNVGKHWVYITNSCVLNNNSNVGVYTSCQKICDLKNVYTIYKNPDIYTTQLTETQYASGELCAMLNNEVLQYNKKSKSNEWCMWHQNIDATEVETLDAVPSFNQDHQLVIPAKFNGKDFIGVNFSDGIYTREYLDIEDGYDFYIPVELQIMDATTYKRDISNIEWGTICLPFEVESNGEVQYFKLDEDPYSVDIKLVKVDKVEKNTPAIFHKLVIPNFINVQELNYKILANTITPPANYSNIYQESKGFNTLHGTFESKNVREDETLTKRYLLNNNFYVVNGYINVKPFRAWLESPLMKGGEVAIEDLISNVKQADALMYDASGRRIAVPQNGQLIIKNGKKQINKK